MKIRFAIALALMILMGKHTTQAQVTSLSQIKANQTYLLRNTNGYGYCITNPDIDTYYATLGGALVDHPSGCANELYRSPINNRDRNCLWYIESDGKDGYYLRNAGNGMYLTNVFSSGWWNQEYKSWYFDSNPSTVVLEPYTDGGWNIRMESAAYNNVSTAYLCAASHSATAMANWTAEDAGSSWQILTPEEDDRLNGEPEDDTPGTDLPTDDGQLGDVQYTGEVHYFYLTDGTMEAIPEQFILEREERDGQLLLTLQGDTTIIIPRTHLLDETTVAPDHADLPVIESFKFNNKFNDQLYTDAEGIIDNEADSIYVQVASIGKSLTASIKLPDAEDKLGTRVWVDGYRNVSKETRRRFDRDYTYTVSRPGQYIYTVRKIRNEVWSTQPEDTNEPWIIQPVTLTADMLSCNWPSTNADQVLPNVLDGDINTYFHSNWSATNNWTESSYYGDGTTTWPYLQIEMAEPIEHFNFSYTTRNGDSNGGYAPQGFIIMGSQDGRTWTEYATLQADRDQMPQGAAVSFTSPVITLGAPCRYVRLQLTASTRKNYLVLSEFSMNSAAPNPDYGHSADDFVPQLISPALYQSSFAPYGRQYRVHVDFLTDNSVAEYRVPRIDIHFGDQRTWGSGMWIGRYGKEFYEDATIQIDGAGIYPDMPSTPMQIRGRGNSSWSGSYNSKNPYRIKFADKQKPFGMPKGRSWVLLANKQSGSMTTNALAMKIADMVQSDGCNHIIPVELYINDQYRGSYNFTEKIGFSNNSIDIEDESKAAMLELDSYYDENYKFRDSYYNLYVNVKHPDFTDPEETTLINFDQIKTSFNNFTYVLRNGKYATDDPASSPLDVQSFVRAWLVTDLTRNTELMHPKSWYIYNTDVSDAHSPWHFGPVWDFDWSYGYEGSSSYFIRDAEVDIFGKMGSNNIGMPFFRQLIQGSEVVQREYYRLWTHFMRDGQLDELLEYCDDYFTFVEPSLAHNATKWSDGRTYATITENSKNWLRKRAEYIYSHLKAFDLNEDIIEPETPDTPDGVVTLAQLDRPTDVYSLNGQRVASGIRFSQIQSTLPRGIYIVNGRKFMVR